jgi:hypothetical protein
LRIAVPLSCIERLPAVKPSSGVNPVSAGHQLDPLEGNVELFRGDLQERRLYTLPQLGLAGEDRDAAIGVDANPGIEEGGLLQAPQRIGSPAFLRERSAQRERDDDRAERARNSRRLMVSPRAGWP